MKFYLLAYVNQFEALALFILEVSCGHSLQRLTSPIYVQSNVHRENLAEMDNTHFSIQNK